jgi:hypothetical protein
MPNLAKLPTWADKTHIRAVVDPPPRERSSLPAVAGDANPNGHARGPDADDCAGGEIPITIVTALDVSLARRRSEKEEFRLYRSRGNQRPLEASLFFATRETQHGFRKRRVALAAGRTVANHSSLGSVLAPLTVAIDEHRHDYPDCPDHCPSGWVQRHRRRPVLRNRLLRRRRARPGRRYPDHSSVNGPDLEAPSTQSPLPRGFGLPGAATGI